MRSLRHVLFALAAGALGGVVVTIGVSPFGEEATVIVIAAAIMALLIVCAWRRHSASQQFSDFFHPGIFPLGYFAFSFLAPLWMAFVMGDPPRAFRRSTELHPHTTLLVALAVAAFAVGILWAPRGVRPGAPPSPVSPARLLLMGRLLILVPLAIAARIVATGGVRTRGQDQLAVSASDSLVSLLSPVSIAAITIMLMAHRLRGHPRLLARLDWVLIGTLVLLTALRGTRGDILAIGLLLLVAQSREGAKLRRIVVVGLILAAASVLVLQYRVEAKGQVVSDSATDIVLGDMSAGPYAAGATAAAVPGRYDYQAGSTFVQDAIRQIPSPLALPLFGPPENTGPRIFRRIVGLSNPNTGYGFSIPAEGYLNFGLPGMLGLCLFVGLVYGWAYPRMSFRNARAIGVMYPVLVAALPFGLRSDMLGFTKNVLYPLVMVGAALIVARAADANGTRRPLESGRVLTFPPSDNSGASRASGRSCERRLTHE